MRTLWLVFVATPCGFRHPTLGHGVSHGSVDNRNLSMREIRRTFVDIGLKKYIRSSYMGKIDEITCCMRF